MQPAFVARAETACRAIDRRGESQQRTAKIAQSLQTLVDVKKTRLTAHPFTARQQA
jgi:hypothetical protein